MSVSPASHAYEARHGIGSADTSQRRSARLQRRRAINEAYQIELMRDAGLVDAVVDTVSGIPSEAAIIRLTWAGHDFLDSSRDSKIWKLAKEQVIKPGASWTFSLLMDWLKQQAHQQVFGVPPSRP